MAAAARTDPHRPRRDRPPRTPTDHVRDRSAPQRPGRVRGRARPDRRRSRGGRHVRGRRRRPRARRRGARLRTRRRCPQRLLLRPSLRGAPARARSRGGARLADAVPASATSVACRASCGSASVATTTRPTSMSPSTPSPEVVAGDVAGRDASTGTDRSTPPTTPNRAASPSGDVSRAGSARGRASNPTPRSRRRPTARVRPSPPTQIDNRPVERHCRTLVHGDGPVARAGRRARRSREHVDPSRPTSGSLNTAHRRDQRARGGVRTRMVLPPGGFKPPASASSATRARVRHAASSVAVDRRQHLVVDEVGVLRVAVDVASG